MKSDFEKNDQSATSETSSAMNTSSTATGAAPARSTPHEEGAQLMLSRLINERISKLPNVKLGFQEKEITVLGLRADGIHGRDESGTDVVVPYAWSYLSELFTQLLEGSQAS
jgi:hypothetical protein